MKICVIGLGYVGAVTASCLARDGHDVLGVDLDETKLDLLRAGKSPVIEEGIDEITRTAAESGRLQVQSGIDSGLAQFDIIFICVGTPSSPNGSQDLTAVKRVAEEVGEALRDADGFPVVVIRSTVYPGSTDTVIRPVLEAASGSRVGDSFGLAFQPEFLREGSSVKDFYNPPYTIIGTDCPKSEGVLRQLFESFPGEFIATPVRVAEMLKLTCNVFHALKITFANEVGRLGRSLGVDSREVMQLVCKDTSLNISPAYLRPGFAYGGSCLPKDLRAMLYLAKSNDVEIPLMRGIQYTNELHIQHAAEMVKASGSRKVGMIGLSFKPGTDDLRESPLVALAEHLIGKGYELKIHDGAVNVARLIGSNRRFIEQTIPHVEGMLTEDVRTVVEHADVLVVGQSHPDLASELERAGSAAPAIVDLVSLDVPDSAPDQYSGICW